MSDKTPDILIPALRQYQHNDCSGLLAGFDYDQTVKIVTNLQQQILDICQPKWIPVTERLPDAEPHRTIEIACISPYPDDEKAPYSIHVSTKIPVAAFEGSYAWREVVLPSPEDTA